MERLPKPTPTWALSFPEPRSHPPGISPEALHELVTTKAPVVDFLVIDVRRTDVDVRPIFKVPWYCRASLPAIFRLPQAVIPGAVNLPAQTFYPLLPTLTTLLEKIPIIIFHCSSSLGRAPRCAGWLEDSLPPDSKCKVFILEGGMKAWRTRFWEDKRMIVVMPLEDTEGTGTGTGKRGGYVGNW